jgi:WXG100 family type VII secretion target
VEVVVSELHSAAARLTDAGQRLQDGLSAVDLEVGQLLGSGWKGGAASAYGKEWEKWHGGAGQIVRGLQTMSQLLTVAGNEYAKTDEQAAGAVSSSFQDTGGSASGSSTGGQGTSPSSTGHGARGHGGGADGLAQQMDLGQSMMAPVSQIGQAIAGLAQQVGQGVAAAAQAASGLAQIRPAGDSESAQQDDAVGRDDERPSAQRPEDQSDESEERERGTSRPGDAASSGDRSRSTAPVEPLRPAPESPSDGGRSTGSRWLGD